MERKDLEATSTPESKDVDIKTTSDHSSTTEHGTASSPSPETIVSGAVDAAMPSTSDLTVTAQAEVSITQQQQYQLQLQQHVLHQQMLHQQQQILLQQQQQIEIQRQLASQEYHATYESQSQATASDEIVGSRDLGEVIKMIRRYFLRYSSDWLKTDIVAIPSSGIMSTL